MNSLYVRLAIATLASACFLFPVAELRACACCTDPGEYRLITDDPLEGYKLAQIRAMTFAPTATLFQTDAGEDENAKGLDGSLEESKISVTLEGQMWRFIFRGVDGKTGVLTLTVPATMTTYAADLHDGKKSAGNGPLLHKEWRIEGVAAGDGIFGPGFTAPARYMLVLQGRGNRCDNAEDFTDWRLAITGEKADYAFFGKLVVPKN